MSATMWDKRARKYDDGIKNHDAVYDKTIESTKALLCRSDVVLDFACASGEISLDIAPHVQRIHGIDTSGKMIELANEKTRIRQIDNTVFDQMGPFDPSFPTDMHKQLLMDLSLNLKAIISQRLVPGMKGKLACAVEVMVNTPYIKELLREGNFNQIKEIMEKGDTAGMQTFDQSLYDLYKADKISIKNALTYADSSTNLEWPASDSAAEF